MEYNLVLQHEAVLDIQEAFEWYEKLESGLGNKLIMEIEICLEKITTHPLHYSYVNDIYRRIRLDRFPYLLIYEIEEGRVNITSLRHAKRKPL